MFLHDAIAGFALGLSLIMAIGAQNVFVLQQGILRSHVFAICLTCALSDAILISIGVGGFGWIVKAAAWLEPFLITAGASFLFVYGAISAFKAWKPDTLNFDRTKPSSLMGAVTTCLALTWLNPHVYLDTVVLLGTVSTQYSSRYAFAAGAIVASFFFFFTLGYGASRVAHIFSHRNAWRILDIVVALVMWAIALRLITQ